MDEKTLLEVRIDLCNILDICVKTAQHRVGEISDEEYKKNIESINTMLKTTQKGLAVKALEQLVGMMSKDEE